MNSWNDHALPVLKTAIEQLDHRDPDDPLTAEQLAEHLEGMSVKEIKLQLKRLTDDHLLKPPKVHPAAWDPGDSVIGYTGEALRRAGEWPTPEQALDRLVKALDAEANKADDPETKSALSKTARWLGTNATTFGLNVAAAVTTGQIQ